MPLAAAPEELPHVVVSRAQVTPVIAELTLEPGGSAMSYLPGQYVLVCDEDYLIPVRSYSVANAPDPTGRLTLLVTEVAGGATSRWLTREVSVGDAVLVSGPYGTFVADPGAGHPVLCLAGGSGLAPVRSLAQDAVCRGVPDPFTVVFSGRTEEDLIDQDVFRGWEAQHPRFRYHRTLTRASGPPPVGRVPEVLPDLVPDLSEHEVFIAGAPGFVAACVRAVRDLGCRAGRLHTEEFYAEPQPWGSEEAGGSR
ncbi:FAD-binding oxidoreductase [Ornithinimicrobium sp. F0845]|uniref:FAD-binding oxidoreductase n=1 Tax=Ornithinimicrobium sp. F0845 TaxID=2926412 RepID=UPI001FF60C9A|nr:FAD-binding oxidoreductase [Ornithinimicrobium sp. F0845]MCK0112203.1 FAD-binding oxidoreductase [Ornithinimicrobium sp. F0845]